MFAKVCTVNKVSQNHKFSFSGYIDIMKTCKKPMPLELSCQVRALYQVAGLRGKELLSKFPGYSKATIYRHAKAPIGKVKIDKRKENKGRPRKLSSADVRHIGRTVLNLRRTVGSFTSRRVQVAVGIPVTDVSNRTIRRAMASQKFEYGRARRKGRMTPNDLKSRRKWCRWICKHLPDAFWREGISFYLDGVGFIYKQNPMDEALSPKAREWRRKNEGLNMYCTAKGKKEGSTQAKFMVAISYGRGVISCEQYTGRINGEKFAEYVRGGFDEIFELSSNPRARRFLQDGDPSQNSKKAKRAMDRMSAKMVGIPARSPDLNPIENVFHLVKKKLESDAIERQITSESFEQFCNRVKHTLLNFPTKTVDNIIDSMPKRLKMVIKRKGQRIRY